MTFRNEAKAQAISQDAYDRCRAITDDQARLHCFEGLTAQPPSSPSPAPLPAAPTEPGGPQPPGPGLPQASGPPSQAIAGKWRLVRTPDPVQRRDVVSIMAMGELAESDVDFAGVNLRCGEPDFEFLVFLIPPLSPRAHPTVAMDGKAFPGIVVPPGTAIQLPRGATVLLKEQWRSLQTLSIDIEDGSVKTHGLISLEGFDKALQMLTTTCLNR